MFRVYAAFSVFLVGVTTSIASAQEIATLKPEATVATTDCLAFYPDGNTLVVGSFFKTVTLWDVAKRKEKATLEGHTEPVTSVAVSPDGKLIASGSWDKTVILWDVTTKEKLATLTGHTDWVNAVTFSPDGKLLASVEVRTRRSNFGKSKAVNSSRHSKPRAKQVPCLPPSCSRPTANCWPRRTFTGQIDLWDLEADKHKGTLKQDDVRAVAFTPDGKQLLAGGADDGTIKIWDVATKEVVDELKGHKRAVTVLAFQPRSNSVFVSGSDDGLIEFWDVTAKKELKSIDAHMNEIKALAFSSGRYGPGHSRRRRPHQVVGHDQDRQIISRALRSFCNGFLSSPGLPAQKNDLFFKMEEEWAKTGTLRWRISYWSWLSPG